MWDLEKAKWEPPRRRVTNADEAKQLGVSFPPGKYFVDVFGEPGLYQEHLTVYGKHGDLSDRSRLPIKRKKFKGRWTYYCDTQV